MHFSIRQRTVVELRGAELLPGDPVAGGHQLRLRLEVQKSGAKELPEEWPRPDARSGVAAWTLELTGAEVTFKLGASSLRLGTFTPLPHNRLVSPSPDSHGGQLEFSLDVSPRALDLVELRRAGGDLAAEVKVTALGFVGGQLEWFEGSGTSMQFAVTRQAWTTALEKTGYCDFVHLDIPIPADADPRLVSAAKSLREAEECLRAGKDADVLARCRDALDALGVAGFGGKTRTDVENWLKQNKKKLTIAERFAAVHAALYMYFSPASHGLGDRESFGRSDATFALGAIASLLRVAPERGLPTVDPPESDGAA